jgi:crotonobetainyl-CoA:carnitine CoA-transferase CaiB-like acyl-CoA transferase
MIAAGNDGLFGRLCDALSLTGTRDDSRFSSNASRVAHRHAVNEAVGSRTMLHTTLDLLDLLRTRGIPCAPIQDIAQVAVDEQTEASGMVERGDGPTALRVPIRFAGSRAPAGTPPPRAGEHTAAILAELDPG